jgi:hypothetical protein
LAAFITAAGLADQPCEATSFDVEAAAICMTASTMVEVFSAPALSTFLKEAHQASALPRVQRSSAFPVNRKQDIPLGGAYATGKTNRCQQEKMTGTTKVKEV